MNVLKDAIDVLGVKTIKHFRLQIYILLQMGEYDKALKIIKSKNKQLRYLSGERNIEKRQCILKYEAEVSRAFAKAYIRKYRFHRTLMLKINDLTQEQYLISPTHPRKSVAIVRLLLFHRKKGKK